VGKLSPGRVPVIHERRTYTTAVFYRRPTREMDLLARAVPSGFSAYRDRAKLANNDYAFDNGYTHWAQAVTITTASTRRVEVWQVYACAGRARSTLLETLPTQEAAEMWMRHRA